MKLTPEARAAVTAAIEEAHVDGRPTREIAAAVVAAVREMEPSGFAWVSDYIDELAIAGAMKVCSDWRRTHQGQACTKKGSVVPVPGFAGKVNTSGAAVQMRFTGMAVADLRRKRSQMETQRNTLSAEIVLLDNLIEIMEADESVATAGDALDVLRERAA